MTGKDTLQINVSQEILLFCREICNHCIFGLPFLKPENMKSLILRGMFLWLCCITGLPAMAAVTDSSAYGFTLRYELIVKVKPDRIYGNLVNDIGSWWNPAHTYSGIATNLSIDPKAQGCFCERIPPEATIEHMRVLYADPGKTLRMQGGLGPLQAMAVNAVMTFSFAKAEEGTKMVVTYTIGGYYPGGFSSIWGIVDRVLAEQMNRLKAYAEKPR